MPAKTKKPDKQTPTEPQGRDLFQTPRYAVELLIPYIPNVRYIWECAAGEGSMSSVLRENGYNVQETDIRGTISRNFLEYDPGDFFLRLSVIVTNPPYSLKRKFFQRCMYWWNLYQVPFALLIPADYSLWTIDAVRYDGCEKIIPSRRIDFITPTGRSGETSSADYHSMWLTKGFNLSKSETFVELTTEMKKNI